MATRYAPEEPLVPIDPLPLHRILSLERSRCLTRGAWANRYVVGLPPFVPDIGGSGLPMAFQGAAAQSEIWGATDVEHLARTFKVSLLTPESGAASAPMVRCAP
jgi:hypothetical protein